MSCRFRRRLVLAFTLSVFLPATAEETTQLDDVSDLAEKARAAQSAPAVAVAAVVDGEIRAAGVSGVRHLTDPSIGKAELTDRFHLGSLTKSFTATLAATMVEEGIIRWDTKVTDAIRIPDLDPGFRDLTLEHLLSNSGGFPKDVPPPIWKKAWAATGNIKTIRLDFARQMLARPPEFAPGTSYEYSNTGFSVAGVMLESEFDDPWETLIRKRIFEPLDMVTAGFRAPAADPFIDRAVRPQPWGHRAEGIPVPPDPFGDNPFSIAPAGAIHCSILDLAKYARFHLLKNPEPILKNADTFEKLHTPVQRNYALGWNVAERDWAGGKVLTHLGSNTMFFAAIWIAPEKKFAAVATANIGGDAGQKACDAAIYSMVERYILKTGAE